jgi:hypothetical protein
MSTRSPQPASVQSPQARGRTGWDREASGRRVDQPDEICLSVMLLSEGTTDPGKLVDEAGEAPHREF